MKRARYLILGFVIITFSCRNSKEKLIQTEYLKSDWSIPDTAFLFVEDSSVLFSESQLEHFPTYKYSVSNDSLYLRPTYIPYQREDYKAIFKILELTKNEFKLEFISSSIYNLKFKRNRKFFFKRDTLTKNSISIRNLEFSSWTGTGGSFPTLDMRIDNDSTVYIMYYNGIYPNEGLFQHKLSKFEFERINQKINRISLDSLRSGNGAPGAGYYTYIINTDDSMTYKYNGCLCFNEYQKDLRIVTMYLSSLISILKFEKSKLDTLLIQNDHNREFMSFANRHYAP